MFCPSPVSSDQFDALDAQLSEFGLVCHVVAGPLGVALIGISWAQPEIIVWLHHPRFSFLEAEHVAARLNTLQGFCDEQRLAVAKGLELPPC